MYEYSKVTEHSPTITAGAYSADDQVGSLITITPGMTGLSLVELVGITIVDQAAQKASIDIFFFDESPTVTSSDNDAANVADAEVEDKCIGFVNVPAANYEDFSANSVATVRDLGFFMKTNTKETIYALLVTRGTPTYAATDDLRIKFTWRYTG